MRSRLLFYLMALTAVPCWGGPSKVQVIQTTGQAFELKVNGSDFYVHGITYGGPSDSSLPSHMRRVALTGANAIRTWGSDDIEAARKILDAAQAHGMMVMAGLWLRHGRAGAEDDDEFNWITDRAGKKEQWDAVLRQVNALKDHPALLMWGLGNEVVLNMATDAEKKAYAKFLGRLASEIKRVDPNHPIASASAWSIAWPWWQDHAPAIDVYGVNTYGGGAAAILGEAKKLKKPRPYLLTEFGARGEWDAPQDRNGLKIEPSDAEKEGTLREGFPDWIEKHRGHNLGGFIFNYSEDINHAGVWLGLRMGNAWRPSYWGARAAFTGKAPPNHWPEIKTFALPQDHAKPGAWIPVDLKVSDKEGEKLAVTFHYNHRVGERQKRDAIVPLRSRKKGGHWEIQAPTEKGLIKAYVFVKDSYPNLSIAQTSMIVE